MPYAVVSFEASQVNTQQSTLVCGVPAITATMGFVHHLQRQSGYEIVACAPITHSLAHDIGHPKFRPTDRDECRSGKVPTLDLFTGTVRQSIVLRLTDERLDERCLDRILPHVARYAGGRIVKTPFGRFAEAEEDLRKLLGRLPAGWLMRDCSDVFRPGVDPLDRLIEAVQRRRAGTIKEKRDSDSEDRHLVPIHVGYAAIEPPQDRPDMLRDPGLGYRHVLAEPITSLAEFVFLHTELKQEQPMAGCFWSYAAVKSDGVFRVVGK